jgi:hypothetical protein
MWQAYSKQLNVKVKFTLEQATKGRGRGQSYSSILSLTTALDGVGGHLTLAALPPGKTR